MHSGQTAERRPWGRRALALAAATIFSLPAWGAEPPPVANQPAPPKTDGWEFQATVYGWGTALDGDIGVRDLPSMPVGASFGDLLSHLQGVLPVSFMAKKDGWTLLFDFFWTSLSDDSSLGTPSFAQADVGLKQTIASAVFGYRLPVGGPDVDLSATAGFRYQRIKLSTTLSVPGLPFALSGSDVKDWLDPVFGLSLQYRINQKWFLNALADIGGFGVGSKLTSQGFVALGYNWTESWSTAIGYRALYTDYQSITGPRADFRYDATMHGPFMSIAYHF